jgi:hypothetical protein
VIEEEGPERGDVFFIPVNPGIDYLDFKRIPAIEIEPEEAAVFPHEALEQIGGLAGGYVAGRKARCGYNQVWNELTHNRLSK